MEFHIRRIDTPLETEQSNDIIVSCHRDILSTMYVLSWPSIDVHTLSISAAIERGLSIWHRQLAHANVNYRLSL